MSGERGVIIKKYIVDISKITILGAALCLFGLFLIVQGLVNRYYIVHTHDTYEEVEIRSGEFISLEIYKEMLLGGYYNEMNGKKVYSAICETDALTGDQEYIVAVNNGKNYYVPISVPREETEQFENVESGDIDSIHIRGKFKKTSKQLDYDHLFQYAGISDKETLKRMISTKYTIQVIDIKNEKSGIYKGIVLFLTGIVVVLGSIYRRKKMK